MEKHSVARMIGAPPGYVGYDEGGYLTEAVRRKPYCVLLLDEVEKAHPDVFNVLLQVLDDGRLTDGQGRTVDFKNTVIVMTSNLGSQQIMQLAGQSSETINDAVWAEVKKHFRPEFLNRIDEAVVFHALDAKNIEAIAKIQLRILESRLEKMDMKLDVSPRALAELAKAGFDPVFGARPLKRAIQREIENPVSKLILEGRFGAEGRDSGRLRRRPLRLRARRPLRGIEPDAHFVRCPRAGRSAPRGGPAGPRPRGRQAAWVGSSKRASSRMICSRASVRLALVLSSTACIARPGFFGTPRSSRWCEPSVTAASGREWPKPSERLTPIIAVSSSLPWVASASEPGLAPAWAIGWPLCVSNTQQLTTPFSSLTWRT